MNTLIGIIAAGGKSKRMGKDKSELVYQRLSIQESTAELLAKFCCNVIISKNKNQVVSSLNYSIIIDDESFETHGPATALLTAAKNFPNSALLFVGCDYPLLTEADIQQLANARNAYSDVVCFHHPLTGFDEPLIAIYEQKFLQNLLPFLEGYNYSLQKTFKHSKVLRVIPNNAEHIMSVDDSASYEQIKSTF